MAIMMSGTSIAPKEDQVAKKRILDRARKQASIRFSSKEERNWDLRYDPNRQHLRGYYWDE